MRAGSAPTATTLRTASSMAAAAMPVRIEIAVMRIDAAADVPVLSAEVASRAALAAG